MTEQIQIRKVSLEEILSLKSLDDKQYLAVKNSEMRGGMRLKHDAEVRFSGRDNEILYVGYSTIDYFEIKQERTISLDEEGLPFYSATIRGRNYDAYDNIFLGNTCYGSAMRGLNQELLLGILDRVKNTKDKLYTSFRSYIDNLIKKLPEIKEAKTTQLLVGDSSQLEKFSKLDLVIFEYLAKKELDIRSDRFVPENYETEFVNLNDKHVVDLKTGSTKEEAAFILWYRGYMKSKDYSSKVEDKDRLKERFVDDQLKDITRKLEDAGYERREELEND